MALDLDGTMLNKHGEVTAGMVEGLRSLRRRGARLIVATGRSAQSLDSLGLASEVLNLFEPVMVLRDGDVILDRRTGVAAHSRTVRAGVLERLLAAFRHVVCEYADEVVATSQHAALRYALLYRFPRSVIRIAPCPAAGGVYKTVVFHDFSAGPPAVAWTGARGRMSADRSRLVVRPFAGCKAAGLHYLLDRFYGKQGFDRVMAIGDGDNDQCLLAAVEQGVAVAHADRTAAAGATRVLSVPLEDFLAGFDGIRLDRGRPPTACAHLADWPVHSNRPGDAGWVTSIPVV